MADYWFIFQNERLLITKDGKTPFITENTAFKQTLVRQHRLGQFEQRIVYCGELEAEYVLPSNIEALPLRKALELLGQDWYTIASKAFAIINWDKNHQFCGRCGAATIHKQNTFERHCPACGLLFYPRISPSIIVLIQKGDEILMARSHHFPAGVYGLIAGFVEAGESIEEAVHREVKEEVGLTIKNLRYFGSQAWPFPDSLMISFYADYASGEINIDPHEIEAAGWYRYDHLPGRPSTKISIGSRLLDAYLAQKTGKTT